ncbi:hypothetical protein GWK47_052158 [Chionoecetes opilio]|uniref:Uncharacterized protein n=1 Tax=Chionoecetes opilio TaxID=41210 RepID=A0A8J4Y6R0_CHIOP|nr:hypothetical protein GWK47_052158 [Chionoecetes opilio]
MFVDFGDCFISSLDKVHALIPAFSTLPCLAIKAELVDIEAANRDWSPEDACRFRELAQCKNFVYRAGQEGCAQCRPGCVGAGCAQCQCQGVGCSVPGVLGTALLSASARVWVLSASDRCVGGLCSVPGQVLGLSARVCWEGCAQCQCQGVGCSVPGCVGTGCAQCQCQGVLGRAVLSARPGVWGRAVSVPVTGCWVLSARVLVAQCRGWVLRCQGVWVPGQGGCVWRAQASARVLGDSVQGVGAGCCSGQCQGVGCFSARVCRTGCASVAVQVLVLSAKGCWTGWAQCQCRVVGVSARVVGTGCASVPVQGVLGRAVLRPVPGCVGAGCAQCQCQGVLGRAVLSAVTGVCSDGAVLQCQCHGVLCQCQGVGCSVAQCQVCWDGLASGQCMVWVLSGQGVGCSVPVPRDCWGGLCSDASAMVLGAQARVLVLSAICQGVLGRAVLSASARVALGGLCSVPSARVLGASVPGVLGRAVLSASARVLGAQFQGVLGGL